MMTDGGIAYRFFDLFCLSNEGTREEHEPSIPETSSQAENKELCKFISFLNRAEAADT